MKQGLRLPIAGALACLAMLSLHGALAASAHPSRPALFALANMTEATASADPSTSTAVSGTLHFVEVYTYSMAPYGSGSHITADFDRDGRTDVIIAETQRPALNSRLVFLRNVGNWQFAATVVMTYPTSGSYLYEVEAADFNQDHWPDLVLRKHCEIDVLLNDQQGGFTTSWTKVDVFRYCGQALAPGDMNGDNVPDIVAGEQSGLGGIVDVFLNNGSGTFFTHSWQGPPLGDPNAGTFHDIVLGDLNHDARPDIVASEIYNGLLTTFINGGTGFTFTITMAQNVGGRVFAMSGGHLNGDDLVDVVLNTTGALHAFVAQGSGVLSETWSISDVAAGFAQALADFDLDGYDDVFSSSFSPGRAYVYLNRPLSGTFQLVWSNNLPGDVYSGAAADLNGDDYPDLIVGEESALHVYRSVILTERFFLPIVLRT